VGVSRGGGDKESVCESACVTHTHTHTHITSTNHGDGGASELCQIRLRYEQVSKEPYVYGKRAPSNPPDRACAKHRIRACRV